MRPHFFAGCLQSEIISALEHLTGMTSTDTYEVYIQSQKFNSYGYKTPYETKNNMNRLSRHYNYFSVTIPHTQQMSLTEAIALCSGTSVSGGRQACRMACWLASRPYPIIL